MKSSFLDYYKVILSKVSFDRRLLRKEYRKAIRSIDKNDHEDFHQWMKSSNLKIS